jgi:hypothetical protein
MSDPLLPKFDLDGLADLARKVSPEIAQQVDSEVGAMPEAAPTPESEQIPASEAEATPAPEAKPAQEPEPEPETDSAPEAETSVSDELEELNRQSEAAKSKTAKPIEPVKPVEAVKPVEPANDRDKDLKLDERASATLHPKTKKIIEERNQKIVAERNRADAVMKEKTELEKQLAELKKLAENPTIPKKVEEEMATLRQRIREYDITKDPAIIEKFDVPTEKNQNQIVDVLKSFGLGVTVDGKPDPVAIERLKVSGINFQTIAPHIKKLSDAGEEGAAETLRELLRENIRLGRGKDKEIGEWKTDFESKRQQQTQQSQQTQDRQMTEIREHASRILNDDLAELGKSFPMVNRPPEPAPTDTPATVRAKQDAITAFDAAAKSVADAVASFDASKMPAQKVSEAHGRMSAAAVQGIILKQHVLPQLAKELASLKARNTELESKAGKIKAAGTLSRAHAAAASAPAGAKAQLPENTEDAAKQIAREMGISIDS